MKKYIYTIFIALVAQFCVSSCSDNAENSHEKTVLITSVVGYGTFGELLLNTNKTEMGKVGFTPGDKITFEIADKSYDVPYYTGYFVRNEELLIVDYPNITNTHFTANNVGLWDLLPGMEGKDVRMTLKEKGAFLNVEQTLGRTYTTNRSDYSSDEVFANAREITTTGMKKGVLYRSASPFNNKYYRAPYVAEFLKKNGVKTSFNLADDSGALNGYTDMPEYSRQMVDAGNVVLSKIDTNYRGENFNRTVVAGLIELINHPAPYVVNCTEGKDRTGYVCAMLEALAGASYDEIANDYLISYDNYFSISQEKDPKACQLLLDLLFDDAMMFFCNVDDVKLLRTINLREAMEQHLMRYGMTREQVNTLEALLSNKGDYRKKVLIDSDIVEGFDDGQAIMMLLKSPNVEVMGITSVTGNTWSQEGIAYGIRQMEICGATDVPIIAGSQYPLREGRLNTLKDEVSKAPGRDSFWMGAVEYESVTDWRKAYVDRYGSQPQMTPRNEDAVDFIIRTLKENPHEVTLLAIGPCTNIAKAIQKEPGIERLAKEIIYNGGSFYIEGNTTPYAEFNVLYDPEAMGVCMRADFPKQTFVSLDVCEIVPMVRKDYMAMMETITNAALRDVFEHCFHYQDFIDNPDAVSHIWDVINACVVIDESVITDFTDVPVNIQDNPNLPEYGRTFESSSSGCKKGRIIKDVDKERIWQMIFKSLTE